MMTSYVVFMLILCGVMIFALGYSYGVSAGKNEEKRRREFKRDMHYALTGEWREY